MTNVPLIVEIRMEVEGDPIDPQLVAAPEVGVLLVVVVDVNPDRVECGPPRCGTCTRPGGIIELESGAIGELRRAMEVLPARASIKRGA
jgi:hypothetical protein